MKPIKSKVLPRHWRKRTTTKGVPFTTRSSGSGRNNISLSASSAGSSRTPARDAAASGAAGSIVRQFPWSRAVGNVSSNGTSLAGFLPNRRLTTFIVG